MKKMGGGLGLVILIVTLVIVLLLSVRSWNSILPVAKQALQPGSAGGGPDYGQSGAGEAVPFGGVPNLEEMKQNTDRPIQRVSHTAQGNGRTAPRSLPQSLLPRPP